jgi:hypothetical protein
MFQNLLKIEGLVTLFEPSKSSINATPFLSPVLEFDIELGFGRTCANSPSTEKFEIFSSFKKLNLFILLEKFSKEVSYLPFTSQMKFCIGSYHTSTFLLTID